MISKTTNTDSGTPSKAMKLTESRFLTVFCRWSSPTYRLFNVDETHSGDYRCQVVITGAAGGDMVSEMSNSLKVIVGGE